MRRCSALFVVAVGSMILGHALPARADRLWYTLCNTCNQCDETKDPTEQVVTIDTETLAEVLPRIDVDECPINIVLDPAGRRAYVVFRSERKLTVIDTATRSIVTDIALPNHANGMAITPDGKKLYVGFGNDIGVIDTKTNQLVKTISNVAANTHDLGITPDGRFVYFSSNFDTSGPEDLGVIDTQTDTQVATPGLIDACVGGNCWGIVVPPPGTRAYAAVRFNDGDPDPSMVIVDTATNTVADEVDDPDFEVGQGVCASPDGAFVYAADPDAEGSTDNEASVAVVRTSDGKFVKEIVLPDTAYEERSTYRCAACGGFIWVTGGRGDPSVHVIDPRTNTLAETLDAGLFPFGVACRSEASIGAPAQSPWMVVLIVSILAGMGVLRLRSRPTR